MKARKWTVVTVIWDASREDVAKFTRAGDAYRYAADLADRLAEIGRDAIVRLKTPYGSERVLPRTKGGAA